MNTATQSIKIDPALEKVKQQFKNWRKTKKRRERIPDSLWQAAAELFHTGDYTLYKISRALRLNQTDLKNYVQQQIPDTINPEPDLPPAFIELELDPPSPASECVIEMEDPSGAKMRMCFRGKTDPSLIELGKFFWRKQA